MSTLSLFQEDLINRYDRPGPQYTLYPPATEFHDLISESDYREWARLSNEELIPRPLSLYFHIPFCSSTCYYCAGNKVITGQKEKAESYLQDLFREIEIQSRLFDRDREVRQLHWVGGTPGFLTHRQSQQLMEKINQHFMLNRDGAGEYSIEIDPRIIVADGVAHLRKLGFNRISIGVQDLDEKVQRAVNRVQGLETTAKAINDARGHGFRSVSIDLIYGLPYQSVASFAATLDTIIDLGPDRIAIYNYAHLPHRFPPQRRIQVEHLPESREKLTILRMAIDKLGVAGYEYIGMDHFAKSGDELARAQRDGSLQRNFQGYSTHAPCDSIGFGVSAISQVSDNFSQNSVSLEDYHHSLNQQKLPVVRGYQSDADDLLRREIIQGLVCNFRVDMKEIGNRWRIDFAQYFADEMSLLAEMERDGLVEVHPDDITVNTA
ncbi:MAG: oxygen-independent coproporphyrinogen III oxidase, partial [Gammaproteobacteria bacterium]|nr:oxygen-independent coproporphyrinogen III oxidase [Gammaproteobacteria bacterium]